MEMIQYTSPVSWDDKGMDWESPDPGNLDYYRAIWEAVIERASLVRQSPNEALHSMMKYRPWSVAAMNAIRESIYTLAPYFVNMEFDDYKEDLSDFPKMWSFRRKDAGSASIRALEAAYRNGESGSKQSEIRSTS